MKENSKSIAIFVSIGLFIGMLFWIFSITQSNDAFQEPVAFVLANDRDYTPTQALRAIQIKKDSIVNGFFNPGFSPYKWWVYINTKQQAGNYLQIANPHINEIRIYTVQNNQTQLVYESGDYFEFKKRLINDPDFWFKIPTSSEGLLVEADKKGESLEIPLRIVSANTMTVYLANQKMAYGIFIGWMIFLILLNVFLWASLRDNIHFFYIVFISSSAIWVFSNWGLGFQYIWPDYPSMASKARPLFSTLSGLSLLELIRRYFTPDEQKPIYHFYTRLIQSLLFVLFVVIAISDLSNTSESLRYIVLSIANILWLLTIVFIVFFIVKNYAKSKELTLFFLFAFVAQLIFSVLIIFTQYNIQGDWVFFIHKYGSAIGILANSTILSFGLTQRYNYYKKEREQAEQALIAEKNLQADRLIHAQEEERSRLARELHDGLGGLLGSIRIGAYNKLKPDTNNQQWLDQQLSEAIEDLRNIAHDLMPVNLPEKGLVAALEKTVSRWNQANQFNTYLNCSIQKRYPLSVEAGLYRIVSELIYNVKKHAAASEVYISLWEEKNTHAITLLVEDNGIGFSPNENEGIGLKNIRYRVEYLGGKIMIDSNPKGTSIVIEISALKPPLHA